MDELSYGILKKICTLTKTGKYVIVSADEFDEKDPETVKRALGALSDGGFINVKYSGEDMFCLAPLKNMPEPDPKPENETKHAPAAKKKIKLSPLWANFLGGALGGFLGSLLILIIAVIYA